MENGHQTSEVGATPDGPAGLEGLGRREKAESHQPAGEEVVPDSWEDEELDETTKNEEADQEAGTGGADDGAGDEEEGEEEEGEVKGDEAEEDVEEEHTIVKEARKEKQSAPTADVGQVKDPDPRPHLNIVFIGHVDAGKSTTCGNILYIAGEVDQRTIEKYERDAKEKNRESWWLAFIMDINEDERAKGKTVELGRAQFETIDRRFTILDAPGHKSFVPNMISGAAQADVGVLIISARKGEFETGFERGGQTREHALLAKTLGVNQLIVAVNKMDDPTCNWEEKRFKEIETKLTPFLRTCGYNVARDIFFIPISGLAGSNLKCHVSDESSGAGVHVKEASWYSTDKPTLWSLLDSLPLPERDPQRPLRIPVLDGHKDQGVIAIGKVESGEVRAGMNCIVMPNRHKVRIHAVSINEDDVTHALPGENVRLRLLGIEEDQVCKGFVLCNGEAPLCPVVTDFVAQLVLVELLEHRPIVTAGYGCVMHAHTACEEVQFVKLLESTDRASKKKAKLPKFVKSNCMVKCEMQLTTAMCLETFDSCPQLGRFTLRDEGRTIAIGKIVEVLDREGTQPPSSSTGA